MRIIKVKKTHGNIKMLYKIFVLKNFAKFTGKQLCWGLFFNKVEGLRPATLLKKTPIQVFSCEFCGIFKNIFFHRIPPVAASEQKKIGQ